MGRKTREWKVVCEPGQFEALRKREDFHQLATLARLMNALRFAQAAIPKKPKRTPASARQQINAFFLLAALVFEGWWLVQRMGKNFRSFGSWRTGFQQILRNREYKSLVETSLKSLRNQNAFHFFEEEARQRLAECEIDDQVVFTTGRGTRSSHAYYDLADLLALRTFTGPGIADAELIARAEPLVTATSNLTVNFLKAGDHLIAEALSSMKFREEPA